MHHRNSFASAVAAMAFAYLPPSPVRHWMRRSWRRVGRLSCMRMKIEGGKIIEAEEAELLEHQ